ncbi:MAG: hypothetical protein WA323_28635 [Candidatus Nitrosopolaris sp.]
MEHKREEKDSLSNLVGSQICDVIVEILVDKAILSFLANHTNNTILHLQVAYYGLLMVAR